ADYMSSPNPALSVEDKDWNYGFQAGLSWLFGENRGMSRVLDTDGDGIRDDVDQCPGTPRGTTVTPNGCPPANTHSIAAAERPAAERAAAEQIGRAAGSADVWGPAVARST